LFQREDLLVRPDFTLREDGFFRRDLTLRINADDDTLLAREARLASSPRLQPWSLVFSASPRRVRADGFVAGTRLFDDAESRLLCRLLNEALPSSSLASAGDKLGLLSGVGFPVFGLLLESRPFLFARPLLVCFLSVSCLPVGMHFSSFLNDDFPILISFFDSDSFLFIFDSVISVVSSSIGSSSRIGVRASFGRKATPILFLGCLVILD
jgi:hypothetical protein